MRSPSPNAALELAHALDIDVADRHICHACLSVVSFELDGGNPAKIRGAVQRVTRYLWGEGFEDVLVASLRRAQAYGIPGAETGLADVEERGPNSATARAVVRVLAAELSRRTRFVDSIVQKAREQQAASVPMWPDVN